MDTSLSDQLVKWSAGVASEVEFWKHWIGTGGSEWPDDFKRRLENDDPWDDNNTPVPRAGWKILDVGSGPLTRLAKAVDGHRLDITAVDPLAPYYGAALSAHGVEPPIPTRQAFAEDLTAVFDENTFDLVNCQNALDHSIDPIRAIEEMLLVTKVDGVVVLTHAVNEAEHEKYDGLHQWNFEIRAGKFVIWNRQETHVVESIYSAFAGIETYNYGKYIRTVLTKRSEPEIDIKSRYQKRLRDTLAASLDAVYRIRLEKEVDPTSLRARPSGIKRFFTAR